MSVPVTSKSSQSTIRIRLPQIREKCFYREAEREIEEKRSAYDDPDLDLNTKRTNFYQVTSSVA